MKASSLHISVPEAIEAAVNTDRQRATMAKLLRETAKRIADGEGECSVWLNKSSGDGQESDDRTSFNWSSPDDPDKIMAAG